MFGNSNFTKTIEGAFEYMYLGSQESALLDYRIYATIRVSYGVPVIDLRVEVGKHTFVSEEQIDKCNYLTSCSSFSQKD
eukprot:UN07031